jgi:Ca2+-transporting ATPase
VSADGIFVEGFNLECDESALTGETEPLKKDVDHPFMLSGTQVCEGVGTMLVTAVGFNTEWGKTLKTIAEEESEETPLQGRLEELAQNIGYVGLTVAGLDFIILTLKYIIITARDPNVSFGWNSVGIIMKYLVFAITIIVMAVPEGLPLAVTISLAFSQRKMLSDNNLVRHLDACETMGSATSKFYFTSD